MAAGAFDSDKENQLHVSTQRPQRAVQNWEDLADRGFGICAALPTHPPDEPQFAAVPQSAALRSRAYAPVLQSYCFAADAARQNQLLWLWLEIPSWQYLLIVFGDRKHALTMLRPYFGR